MECMKMKKKESASAEEAPLGDGNGVSWNVPVTNMNWGVDIGRTSRTSRTHF